MNKFKSLVSLEIADVASNLNMDLLQPLLNQKFDMMLSTNVMSGYISDLLDCPVIILSPPGPLAWYTELIGNTVSSVAQTAALSNVFNKSSSFMQRLRNLGTKWGADKYFYDLADQLHYHLARRLNYTGPSLLTTLRRRTQLVISNDHPIFHDPQPFLENVVHVGGMHIRPEVEKLPDDLQQLLDGAEQGALLVSFGSYITPSLLSNERRKVFLQTFQELNIPVLWRWDSDYKDDLPNNVVMRKWLPQQSILAHKNLKVFVTHGGLFSLMEALYYETLVVGLPFANDQLPNLVRTQDNNIGIQLEWNKLTKDILVNSINKAMTDRTMAEKVKSMSRLFKDTQEKPLDRAANWIEFAIRNNGTDFLKPLSLNMKWHQAWNLDIYAAILAVTIIMLFVLITIARFLYRCCSSSRKSKRE